MLEQEELNELSLKDLKDLRKRVDDAITYVEVSYRKKAMESLQETAKEYGFSLEELVDRDPSKKSTKTIIPAKYRDPNNPAATWTGRGRRPKWVESHLEDGGEMKDLEIH